MIQKGTVMVKTELSAGRSINL